MDWAKTTARGYKKHPSFGIWCDLYCRFYGSDDPTRDGRSCPPRVSSNMSETDTVALHHVNSFLIGSSDGDSSALVSSPPATLTGNGDGDGGVMAIRPASPHADVNDPPGPESIPATPSDVAQHGSDRETRQSTSPVSVINGGAPATRSPAPHADDNDPPGPESIAAAASDVAQIGSGRETLLPISPDTAINGGAPVTRSPSPHADNNDLPGPESGADTATDVQHVSLLHPPSVTSASPDTPPPDLADARDHSSPHPDVSRQSGSKPVTNEVSSKNKKLSNRKSKHKSPAKSQSPAQCKPGCSVSGKRAKDMIRCSLCMCWYHNHCVGEDSKYVGVWTCENCRNIPATIVNMQAQIADLVLALDMYKNNNTSQKDDIQRLKSENNRLRQKVTTMENHNKELTKLIETMSDFSPPGSVTSSASTNVNCDRPTISTSNRFDPLADMSPAEVSDIWPKSRHPARNQLPHVPRPRGPARREKTNPVPVTVVGSSMVRGVGPFLNHSKDHDAVSFVYPGRTAKYINGSLKDIPESDFTVLSAGSNNIEKQSVKDCAEEIRQTIDNISRKRRGKHVIMCQIPRRFDKIHLNNKIDVVNKLMSEVIEKYRNVHLLRHDVIQADFKKDGLHFNNRGIAKFALEIKRVIHDVKSIE